MNLITLENISKSYSEKELFNNVNLGINEGDKVGVIGINGTGKSTLLKIVAGLEVQDSGRIIKNSSINIEYLPQLPEFDAEKTVIEEVFRGNSPVMKAIREYEEALQNKNTNPDRIMEIIHNMDNLNAWNVESEAKSVLTKLGIMDFNVKVGTLSGGQRKRIALAGALVNPSDLLILDEPTNHLDNETIDWLEEYLNKRKGALLMITHDRYFLDRVVNKIVEIDRGNLYTYEGNYSVFLQKKIEREEIETANEKKRQSLLKKELAWIKRGAKARSTKQKARIDRFEKLSDEAINLNEDKLEISVAGTRLGKKVIELNNITKSFGDKKVIDNFSYIVLRGDRVGIIGPNGSGKSTLMNIISGKVKPDSGTIDIGETVKIGMFSQESYHMNENMRVIEYIREGAEFIENSEGYKLSASQMLERFLFSGAEQWTPISKLSGGEKRRLYLLRVLMESPNVLLLDEPTNDLDIETLKILEDYIDEFPGAVISVSHDRYFLDRMAERIFSFEGKGKITKYTGNYSEIKKLRDERILEEEKKSSNHKEDNEKNKNAESLQRKKPNTLKFSYKEQREYDEIDTIIANLEQKLEQIQKDMNYYSTDYAKLNDLIKEKEETEKLLEEKMDRWVYLNELAEKIEEGKRSLL